MRSLRVVTVCLATVIVVTATAANGVAIPVMALGEFFANPQWPDAVKARVAVVNRAARQRWQGRDRNSRDRR